MEIHLRNINLKIPFIFACFRVSWGAFFLTPFFTLYKSLVSSKTGFSFRVSKIKFLRVKCLREMRFFVVTRTKFRSSASFRFCFVIFPFSSSPSSTPDSALSDPPSALPTSSLMAEVLGLMSGAFMTLCCSILMVFDWIFWTVSHLWRNWMATILEIKRDKKDETEFLLWECKVWFHLLGECIYIFRIQILWK